jgi:hypothetical protein
MNKRKFNQLVKLENKRRNSNLTKLQEERYCKLQSEISGLPEKLFTKEYSDKLDNLISDTENILKKNIVMFKNKIKTLFNKIDINYYKMLIHSFKSQKGQRFVSVKHYIKNGGVMNTNDNIFNATGKEYKFIDIGHDNPYMDKAYKNHKPVYYINKHGEYMYSQWDNVFVKLKKK